MKALEFINSRRSDLEIRANFLLQIQKYTKRKKSTLTQQVVQRSEDWTQSLTSLRMYKNF